MSLVHPEHILNELCDPTSLAPTLFPIFTRTRRFFKTFFTTLGRVHVEPISVYCGCASATFCFCLLCITVEVVCMRREEFGNHK